jgi:hypothetical protein
MKDDWGGLIWLMIIIGGGAFLWSQFTDKSEAPPQIETSPVPLALQRPSGLIPVTTFEAGTVWRLDADTVRGSQEARQAWIVADHSNDKTVARRETKTLYRIDCNTTAYWTLSVVDYDKEGNSVGRWGEGDFKKEADYPPPGSNIAAVIDLACSEVFSQPEVMQPLPTGAP